MDILLCLQLSHKSEIISKLRMANEVILEQEWWCTPAVSALSKLRQEDSKSGLKLQALLPVLRES